VKKGKKSEEKAEKQPFDSAQDEERQETGEK